MDRFDELDLTADEGVATLVPGSVPAREPSRRSSLAPPGIIEAMTERTANDAGAIACPFVAFVDDRDERADVPDHRHRCYAEIRPAQRALAHQQAFCLSAGFAACPTFQDWARREAARARGGASAGRPVEAVGVGADSAGSPSEHDDRAAAATSAADDLEQEGPFDDRATRNPRRGWAAPPPWVDPAGAGSPGPAEPEAPSFLAPRPAGAHAEESVAPTGLSSSRWLQEIPAPRPDEAAAGPGRDDDELERALAEDRANRERAGAAAFGGVSATASSSRAARKAIPPATPQTVSSARRRPVARDAAGPSWERPRRYEAYPTLKTRIGLPSIPRIGLAALAILVAAGVLFIVPFLLKGGEQGGGAVVSPSPSAGPSVSVAPSEAPAPTAQVYIVKSGDTLNKIAKKFGLTVDQLLAANKQIKNPNKIQPGDEITIPVAAPSEIVSGASTPPSAAP
jgi:nucleoid-associated protein YgaU